MVLYHFTFVLYETQPRPFFGGAFVSMPPLLLSRITIDIPLPLPQENNAIASMKVDLSTNDVTASVKKIHSLGLKNWGETAGADGAV